MAEPGTGKGDLPTPGETPFHYRFRSTKAEDGTLRVYGPQPLAKVIRLYGSNEECEARPADGRDADWRLVSAWVEEYQPPLLSDRQRKRLAKLGVQYGPDISEEEARELIRGAEDELPPTEALLAKAKSAGVIVSDSDTRGSIKDRIGEAEGVREVARLRERGAPVPEDASWEQLDGWERRLDIEEELTRKGLSFPPGTPVHELEEAVFLMEDLKEAATHARPSGVRYKVEKGIDLSVARSHSEALGVIGDIYEQLQLECDGRGGGPKKADLKEALSALFERLTSGSVSSHEAEAWVRTRLGMDKTAAGCASLVILLVPVGMAGGLLLTGLP